MAFTSGHEKGRFLMTDAAQALQAARPADYRVALILGSGLSALASTMTDAVALDYADLPAIPQSGVSGHGRQAIVGELAGAQAVLFTGRSHYYETGNAAAMWPIIETIKALGCKILLLTNSAGSLREDMPPPQPMMITDHINFAGANPLIGVEDERRFVGVTQAYDAKLQGVMREAARAEAVAMGEGVYMWFSGPSFETPAEIRMARRMGADAVGMSTVPEVLIARYFGLRVAALSMITNLAAGMTADELSHSHTKEMAAKGVDHMSRLITAFVERL